VTPTKPPAESPSSFAIVVSNSLVRRSIVTLAIVLGLTAGPSAALAQAAFGDLDFVIRMPAETDMRPCDVFSTGTSGEPAKPDIPTHTFHVRVKRTERTGQLLRAIVECPGFQAVLLDYPSLPNGHLFSADVKLVPLKATLPFAGIVVEGASFAGLTVTISYLPWWHCEFFQLADCGMGGRRLASAHLDRTGKFAFRVPDFLADPGIRKFKSRGELQLFIRDEKAENILHRLVPLDIPENRLTEQTAYPREVRFRALAR
jgi:hypothetical protein